MTEVWPTSVPLMAAKGSYSEKPERNVVTFTPEVGPPKDRKRAFRSELLIEFDTEMTFTQWDTLLEFYRGTLKGGSLSFTRASPRNTGGPTVEYLFVSQPSARAANGWDSTGVERARVAISLRTVS